MLKKGEYQPLTPKDMNIPKASSDISTELIYDGMLIEENLNQLNKDRNWIIGQLKMQGISDISGVFLATLNPSGSLYIDKYDDHIKK